MSTKTLKLTDLYVVGKEYTVTGPEGEVTVWLQKLSPVDHETALRRAAAKRAKAIAMARSDDTVEEDELYNSVLCDFYDMCPNREQQIDYLVQIKLERLRAAREAEIADREEWSKDDYLQGLKDLWNEEMRDRFINDAEDEEAKKVSQELERFNKEFEKETERERKRLTTEFEALNDKKLVDRGVKTLLEAYADMSWLQEFRRSEIWLGVRKDKKTRDRMFATRTEVDDLPAEILGQLIRAYEQLNVDPIEGKD